MISVTYLCSYLYCARKLYLNLVLGLKEKVKDVTIKGKIKHQIYEVATRREKEVIVGLDFQKKIEDFEMDYRRMYNKVVMWLISQSKKEIEEVSLKTLDLYKELWPFFVIECKKRSKEVFDFAHLNNVFGVELWESLPRGLPELYVKSEKLGLKGRIDNVDDKNFIPVEYKTGRAPDNGAWKNHIIQIGAYMLLLSEHYGKEIKEGFVDYKEGERVKVIMNPFLRDEILELKDKVEKLLKSSELPPKIEGKKCEVCGLREECYSR
ncbi:CRISPR-associated protein Cas4 [archaeon]|nr:CRISPR-associated protein Cas4 [archaeon]